MKNRNVIVVTAFLALGFAGMGQFIFTQDEADQFSDYSYYIEGDSLGVALEVSLVVTEEDPLSVMDDVAWEKHLENLSMILEAVMVSDYIPVSLKKNILIGLDEDIFDLKAAMERARSARLSARKLSKTEGAKGCVKCLPKKQNKKLKAPRFLEGQSWV